MFFLSFSICAIVVGVVLILVFGPSHHTILHVPVFNTRRVLAAKLLLCPHHHVPGTATVQGITGNKSNEWNKDTPYTVKNKEVIHRDDSLILSTM